MKISELIKNLQSAQNEYGDLEVTLHMHINPEGAPKNYAGEVIARSDDIYIGLDKYKDESDKIDIRSFLY